jgi:DNA polymerase (family X)
MAKDPTNTQIADLLERLADLLEAQDDNPFRVRAYREGAQTLRETKHRVSDFIRQDRLDDLKALPNIGDGIAAVIGEYVTSGKSTLLDDVQAKESPTAVFARVPGIGEELAQRIADQLDIKTLPELEEAAHDGRLARVEGFGSRRIEAVLTSLAGMLSQTARRTQRERQTSDQKKSKAESRPSVELLLKVDEEYRKRAKAGELRKITPRRFNPTNKAWLPVMDTKRDGWKFTALYSNTAQAHKLEKTDDWVVIYYQKDGKERQNTVVTETQGSLKGKRVVRGRALENQRFYEAAAA